MTATFIFWESFKKICNFETRSGSFWPPYLRGLVISGHDTNAVATGACADPMDPPLFGKPRYDPPEELPPNEPPPLFVLLLKTVTVTIGAGTVVVAVVDASAPPVFWPAVDNVEVGRAVEESAPPVLCPVAPKVVVVDDMSWPELESAPPVAFPTAVNVVEAADDDESAPPMLCPVVGNVGCRLGELLESAPPVFGPAVARVGATVAVPLESAPPMPWLFVNAVIDETEF